MDNTKHNQPAPAQDSDDLIAELARLVAQDARNTSSRSDAYKRQEPSLAPEPDPVEPEQNEVYQDEPGFDASGPQEPEFEPEPPDEPVAEGADPAPDFDFTDRDEPAPGEGAGDPIAELIADAEVEAYERDFAQENDWADTSEPVFPVDEAPSDTGADFGYIDDFMAASVEQPAPEPSPAQRDPLREIEALIGEAAQANGGDASMPGRRVRSSFLDDAERDAAVDAAESAILAAAAATGTPVRRTEPAMDPESWLTPQDTRREEPQPPVEEPFEPEPAQYHPDPLFAGAIRDDGPGRDVEDDGLYEDEDEEMLAERPRRRLGGFVVPVAAGAIIVALIGGVYMAFFSGPGDPGEAPVLTADSQPVKQDAEPTRTETAASESVVFNEIEGNTASPEDETLVSRDQTEGASGAQVAGVLAPEEGEMELVNRPVRTVTVRPDGTIVQAEDSVAGSNVLPVERPDVPPVPNSTLTSDPIGEAIAQAMSGGAEAAAEGAEQVADLEPTLTPAAPEATDAADEAEAATSETGDALAPRPIPRPGGLAASNGGGQANAPALAPVATPEPAATPEPVTTPALPVAEAAPPAQAEPAAPAATPASTPGAWVQLASQRSEEVARAGMADLQNRYGSLFNGTPLEVSQVDLGERGIYYRVRLPQPTLADANAVCNAIKAQGGDCFVM